MNSNERREKILETLKQSTQPVSATVLANKFEVSRQIIVGDIALLRAANMAISATPRGYIMQKSGGIAQNTYTIACKHNRENLSEELYAVVDNGGGFIDVIVEHALYGQLSGQLHIFSRYDADAFLKSLDENQAAQLSTLTDGIHLHTIACQSEEAYHRICALLTNKGILLEM
ncbi:transcription repressor NadR [Oscillospiraceae bacterium PP1C4]